MEITQRKVPAKNEHVTRVGIFPRRTTFGLPDYIAPYTIWRGFVAAMESLEVASLRNR
jgi:hypothetical protein